MGSVSSCTALTGYGSGPARVRRAGQDLPQSLGAVKGQRALPALTAQCLQQARQAEDMVA